MIKKTLVGVLCVSVLVGVTGCESNDSKSSSDVVSDLNHLVEQCTKENTDSWECKANDDLQTYFKTYSDYRFLNVSNSEFASKPQDDNNLMSYGTLTDFMCDYDYVLIYNVKTGKGYSVKLSCEDKSSHPTFDTATELK